MNEDSGRTTAAPRHPRLDEMIAELHESRRELLDLMREIPPALHERQPAEDRWSIRQVLEHLAVVEDGSGRLISKLIRQVRELGATESEHDSLLNTLDHLSVANPTRRARAPELVQPLEGRSVGESLERLQESRARLLTVLDSARGLGLGTVSAPHPLLGQLDVYRWLLATAQHERRHIHQIREIARSENSA
jgi:hypothetical protein